MTGGAAGSVERIRPFSPIPLRQRQREATRDIILRAAADIISSNGIHAFTIQEVADRAGISHRSVYRYFPTRDALVDGLYDFAERMALPSAASSIPILKDVPLSVETFSFFDREPAVIRASVLARLTTGYEPRGRIQRTKAFEAGVRRLTRNLDRGESHRSSAVLRLLASSYAWLVFREDFGLGGEDAIKAVSWAVEVLIRDLTRRNRRAGRKGKRRAGHG